MVPAPLLPSLRCEGGQKSFCFPRGCTPGTELRGGLDGFLDTFQPKGSKPAWDSTVEGTLRVAKKWIESGGLSDSYLLMPLLRTVLLFKEIFDTFIYPRVLVKGKANEASNNEIWDKNVEMLCQVWVEKLHFHVTPAVRILCL